MIIFRAKQIYIKIHNIPSCPLMMIFIKKKNLLKMDFSATLMRERPEMIVFVFCLCFDKLNVIIERSGDTRKSEGICQNKSPDKHYASTLCTRIMVKYTHRNNVVARCRTTSIRSVEQIVTAKKTWSKSLEENQAYERLLPISHGRWVNSTLEVFLRSVYPSLDS